MICKKHGTEKRRYKSGKTPKGTDKWRTECLDCLREYAKERYARFKERVAGGVDPGPKRDPIVDGVRASCLPQPALLGQNLDTDKAIRFFDELCRSL